MKIERINDWFARQGRWMVQKRWLVLSLFILVFAIGFTGLRYFKVSASWENYFLEDDPMLVKTKEFKDIFGNDNFAAVLTQCDNSFMKENLELIRELTNEMMDSISYADKITSLTDIEFMVGNEEGMTIEQIVPDLIPTDAASLETIRRKAYMKPHIAERLVSKDGTLSWIILKLRTFPKDSVWNKGKNAVSPEVLTGNELEHIITKDKYQKLHPRLALRYRHEDEMDWQRDAPCDGHCRTRFHSYFVTHNTLPTGRCRSTYHGGRLNCDCVWTVGICRHDDRQRYDDDTYAVGVCRLDSL